MSSPAPEAPRPPLSPGRAIPWQELGTVLVAGLVLAAWHYGVASRHVETTLLDLVGITTPDADALWRPVLWAASSGLLFFIPAALWVRLGLGGRLSDCGMGAPSRSSLRDQARLVGTLALLLGLVLLVSGTPEFRRIYPIGHGPLWLFVYAAHFVGIEFFFRGVLLFPFEARYGSGAILIGALPYAMTHFQKPPLEALASLPAGLLMAAVALNTRSIWPGAALHVGVAVGMELIAGSG